jgi:hypothetical protein
LSVINGSSPSIAWQEEQRRDDGEADQDGDDDGDQPRRDARILDRLLHREGLFGALALYRAVELLRIDGHWSLPGKGG